VIEREREQRRGREREQRTKGRKCVKENRRLRVLRCSKGGMTTGVVFKSKGTLS
jgi:hypothetical protein